MIPPLSLTLLSSRYVCGKPFDSHDQSRVKRGKKSERFQSDWLHRDRVVDYLLGWFSMIQEAISIFS